MIKYNDTNFKEIDWDQLDKHSQSKDSRWARGLFDSRIQLNSGLSNDTPEHMYRMTFRCVTCPKETDSNSDAVNPHICNIFYPGWPSSITAGIDGEDENRSEDLRWHYQFGRQDLGSQTVVTSCCATENNNPFRELRENTPGATLGRLFLLDSKLTTLLYNYTRSVIQAAGIRRFRLELLRARIIWEWPEPHCEKLYEDQTPVLHSPEVTEAHLALVRERGHIDHIHMEFRYDLDHHSGFLGMIKRVIQNVLRKPLNP